NLKLAKLSGDPTKESNAYRALGVVFMNSGNNYKALDLFLKAYKKAEESRDVVLQGRAFNALGGIHSYEGNYKKSIDYFLKALQSSEISGDERFQLAATVSIGIAYLSVDVDSALYYTNKGLQMANRMKVSSSQAIATNNLGEINLFMNNYSLAMEYYRLAAPRFV
ncbi:MAG TPA: tetratricopeptide repeat protein, partial [Niabella sp.]|nr:tetratricopeptide repeat protein [Niabella sp.]